MAEDMLLALLFLDLKGPKNKRRDWITIAKECEEVMMRFGSVKEASGKLGVSPALLRAIISLRKLPAEIQELIKQNEILFDAAQRINTIKSREKQIEVAQLIKGLPSHKQREIILQAKRFPDSDLIDFRNRSISQPVKKEKIRVMIIPMREELYQSIEKQSVKMGRPVEKLVLDIIGEWLVKKEGVPN